MKKQRSLNKAISAIKNGKVLVCPTDTVYGIIADATNKKAVEKIFKTKKRPKSKPLAIFVKDMEMAKEIAEIDSRQEKILKKHWPGRFTFRLKRKKTRDGRICVKLYGVNEDTIALRIPKYKFLNDLLEKIDRPLAQTSANISGEPPLTEISDICRKFKRTRLIIIIGAGNSGENNPSKIYDLTFKKTRVLRN